MASHTLASTYSTHFISSYTESLATPGVGLYFFALTPMFGLYFSPWNVLPSMPIKGPVSMLPLL